MPVLYAGSLLPSSPGRTVAAPTAARRPPSVPADHHSERSVPRPANPPPPQDVSCVHYSLHPLTGGESPQTLLSATFGRKYLPWPLLLGALFTSE